MNKTLSDYLKFSIIFFSCMLGFWGIYIAGDIIMLSLLGIGMGIILSPLIQKVKRTTKLPQTIGTLLIILLASLPFLGILYWVGLIVAEQLENFIEELPQLKERLLVLWQQTQSDYPFTKRLVGGLNINSNFPDAKQLTGSFFKGLSSMGNVLTAGLYVMILFFFCTIRMNNYYSEFLQLFSRKNRMVVSQYCSSMAHSLRACFIAQLLDMLVVGALTSIGLLITGFKYWLLLGFFTGLFCIIPYLGMFISIVAATLLALSTQPNLIIAVWVVYAISQFVEGNLILPFIMRTKVELPEVPLLIALFISVKWFGLIGAFMAPSLLSIGLAALRIHQDRQHKRPLRQVA